MTITIVDITASSLLPGSFPIEIAWVQEDGTGESHLIRPSNSWLDPCDDSFSWSFESERTHGISLETLLLKGEPVEVVARRAFDILYPLSIETCSDSPPSDDLWLERLFDAGGIRRAISTVDIRTLYGWTCRPLLELLPPGDDPERTLAEERSSYLSRTIIERAEETERVARRVRHRALPHALSLWRTRQAIMTEVQRQLEEAAH